MGVFLTAAAIGVAAAVGVLSERRWPSGAANAARRALVLMLYVLLPPVIFLNVASSEITLDNGVGLALGLVSYALSGILAWFVASRVLKLPRPAVGAVICTVISVNSGYLGYPLTLALLGHDDLSDAVLWDVLVTGPALLLGAFAIGAAFGDRAGDTPRERVIAFFTRNPPLYAAIAGLLAPRALAPEFLVDASQALVVAILPIGFFAVGATLAENADEGELPIPPPLTRPVMVSLFSRLAVTPLVLLALAAPLIDLPTAYLLMSAMPSGLNSLVVAHAYGLDMEITAEAVTWSTSIVVAAALLSLIF